MSEAQDTQLLPVEEELKALVPPAQYKQITEHVRSSKASNKEAYETQLKRVVHRQRQILEERDRATMAGEGYNRTLAEEQLGAGVDLSKELPFSAGASEMAAHIFGGGGGNYTIEGQVKDIQKQYPDADIQVIEQVDAQGRPQAMPFIRMPGSTEYIPVNKDGLSMFDLGEAVGGVASAEGALGMLAFKFPMASWFTRAFVAGTLSAIGAGTDLTFAEDQIPPLEKYLERVGMSFGMSMLGDAAFTGSVYGANVARGKRPPGEGGAIEEAAREAVEIQKRNPLMGELLAGQDRGFTSKIVSRLSQFSDAFRNRLINQNLAFGRSFEDIVSEYESLDDIGQALYTAGLDDATLERLYQRKIAQIEEKTRIKLGSPESPHSRSAGGKALQRGLFQISNRERMSYRRVANDRLARLEEDMMEKAGSSTFEIDISDVQAWINEQLESIPIQQTSDIAGYQKGVLVDASGNTIDLLKRIDDANLRHTMETIAAIPDGKITNNITVPAWIVTGRRSNKTGGKPTLGTPPEMVEISGIEALRHLRTRLSDYYGNELISGTSQAGIAKQLYTRLNDSMKKATGDPDFINAFNKYNRNVSGMYSTLEKMHVVNLAREADPASLVSAFTAAPNGWGAETARTVKRALMHTGPQGQRDWAKFKSSAIDQYLADPQRIDNIARMDREARNLIFTPDEVRYLQEFRALVRREERDSFVRRAQEHLSTQRRAVSLFREVPEEDFVFLMKELPEHTKQAMRSGVLSDMLMRSRVTSEGGVQDVVDPKKMAHELNSLMMEMGPRAKELFTPRQYELLTDHRTMANFLDKVSHIADAGNTIAAANVTSQMISGEGEKMFKAFIRKVWEQRLANFLVDTKAGQWLVRPKIEEGWTDAGWLRLMSQVVGAHVNATQKAQSPQRPMDHERMLERARRERIKRRGAR